MSFFFVFFKKNIYDKKIELSFLRQSQFQRAFASEL